MHTDEKQNWNNTMLIEMMERSFWEVNLRMCALM